MDFDGFQVHPNVPPDAPPPEYLWQLPDPFVTLARVSAHATEILDD